MEDNKLNKQERAAKIQAILKRAANREVQKQKQIEHELNGECSFETEQAQMRVRGSGPPSGQAETRKRTKKRFNEQGEELLSDEDLKAELQRTWDKYMERKKKGLLPSQRGGTGYKKVYGEDEGLDDWTGQRSRTSKSKRAWYAGLTEDQCEELMDLYESTKTAVLFLFNLLAMIISMFAVISIVFTKFFLWLAQEEIEVVSYIHGDESFGQASFNMTKYCINLFFGIFPFSFSVMIIFLNIYMIVQEKACELYFLTENNGQILQLFNVICGCQLFNLSLLILGYCLEDRFFDSTEIGIDSLHLVGNVISFVEILSMILLSHSRIEDCHKVFKRNRAIDLNVQMKAKKRDAKQQEEIRRARTENRAAVPTALSSSDSSESDPYIQPQHNRRTSTVWGHKKAQ